MAIGRLERRILRNNGEVALPMAIGRLERRILRNNGEVAQMVRAQDS